MCQECCYAVPWSLTGQRVHSYSGTHLLEVTSELSVLADILFVFGRKLLQVFAKRVQLRGDLVERRDIQTHRALCS